MFKPRVRVRVGVSIKVRIRIWILVRVKITVSVRISASTSARYPFEHQHPHFTLHELVIVDVADRYCYFAASVAARAVCTATSWLRIMVVYVVC